MSTQNPTYTPPPTALRLELGSLLEQALQLPTTSYSAESAAHVQNVMLNYIYNQHKKETEQVVLSAVEKNMLNWMIHSSLPRKEDPPDIRTIMSPEALATVPKPGTKKVFTFKHTPQQNPASSRDIKKPTNGHLISAFVIGLLKERHGKEYPKSSQEVCKPSHELRALAAEVHYWVLKELVKDKYVATLEMAYAFRWKDIPREYKLRASLRLEELAETRHDLPLSRCEKNYLAVDLLMKQVAKRRRIATEGKDNLIPMIAKEPQVLNGTSMDAMPQVPKDTSMDNVPQVLNDTSMNDVPQVLNDTSMYAVPNVPNNISMDAVPNVSNNTSMD